MAKNDVILLDGIIQERMTVELLDRGATFELFAFEQILKSYDLTRDEIDAGWVDGKDDGGIDGFYTFINGVLLQNPEGYIWPKRGATIDIWILSCKHQDTFKQAPLNSLFPTIEELLDFSKIPANFIGHYSEALIKARQIAAQAFRCTAVGLPTLNFYFAYASRGDLTELGENIEARGNQLKRVVSDYFSAASISLEYFGAAELIALHRKNRFVLELPYTQCLTGEQGAFVLLVDIEAYARFVSDEHGNLRRYMFDSNVRDFLGANRVNQDIASSLLDDQSPDFWWLNNGITILATNVFPLGRTSAGNVIQLHDVQIVNGLQTTQSIYNHFKSSGYTQSGGRCVLIKVIVSEDSVVRDRIIQATNNQSAVELGSLNATDKIQRDIEEILERHEWYYERRKNYYKNIGKPQERFVTPLFLASALLALVKKVPHKAGILKSKFMRNSISYNAVFSDKVPIEIWPKLVDLMKAVETGMINAVSHFSALPLTKISGERSFGTWRGAVALCVLAKLHGTFDFNYQMILDTNIDLITPEFVEAIFSSLRSFGNARPLGTILADWYISGHNDRRCRKFGELEGLAGIEIIGRWIMPNGTELSRVDNVINSTKSRKKIKINDETMERVNAILPDQPWPSGTQKYVAETLNLDRKTVQECVMQLIALGKRFNQRDGVVINAEGYIIAIDAAKALPQYSVGQKYQDNR